MNVRDSPLFKSTLQSLWKLVPILRKLSHQGIAPFLGVDTELFPLAWVYGCEASVDIMQYLKLNPLENRVDLVGGSSLQITRRISLPRYSCCKSRGPWNTFTPLAFSTGLSAGSVVIACISSCF